MVGNGGGAAPILISGGGIGGLVTAYALARQGMAVRVFEQSPEFREVGAGIQLGPNIFRVLEKIGLKDAVLADAHIPPAQEMRDALTGKLIANIPLGDEFVSRFGQPYAVTHRADIHATFLNACQSSNLITLENSRKVDGYEDHGDHNERDEALKAGLFWHDGFLRLYEVTIFFRGRERRPHPESRCRTGCRGRREAGTVCRRR